ncbi:hypothetical protein [Mycobacterium sp. AZCC_0083]|uniref:hypothetical protein n=1 Tax=Mycobacterium sp. AZCC_0083 TaxID=2735882 RepID=UPI00162260EC|nr:hypothetical protein [Mycobacterium sp. AZCC_0083]MBB5167042.1 outer membrane biosynthesis protein TonB [Mycobacterium sp. AZCC_0083]
MNVSARSYVAAGIAALTAGVIAIPTSALPPASLSASVQKEQVALLAAARSFTAPVQPPVAFVVLAPPHAVAPTAAPNSSPGAVVNASPTAAPAAAQAALAGLPGIQNAIINAYNVIDPWVDYGVNVAQYAVGWIPVVGIFAPQIGIFYYDLIEPIATSAIFNTAYVLGGSIGLVQGISNVINDSINAGIGFVNAEVNWALSFLPPLPPIPFAAAQATSLKVAAGPTTQATTDTVDEKHEPGVATSAEPSAKPAADPTAPEAPKSPTQPATETATEPATPKPEAEPATTKPEAEPVKKPESTTTGSSGGVAAQGEVRGGTQSATDEKTPGASKPDASKGDKGDRDAASTANKPAESPQGTKTSDASKTGDADKTGDANNSVGSAHRA